MTSPREATHANPPPQLYPEAATIRCPIRTGGRKQGQLTTPAAAAMVTARMPSWQIGWTR
ncbi:hypothetical protein DUNSADRAFT_7796 [Dunaliella salina]|uniref:Encoded protein n=1 Tax=Dunaliella salina TaxID=3046 RepID=A0ABQ7GKM8_DUNSA|nr:hypothetical protein DUNSADRAFT_7796 [Dunaliella salina]|eukprot:KAF5835167.1 hypothetical protein DUNSADRAFT_7796 [Dunaliella salina]